MPASRGNTIQISRVEIDGREEASRHKAVAAY